MAARESRQIAGLEQGSVLSQGSRYFAPSHLVLDLVPIVVSAMKTVLFLCTGNYYRSRYAEIHFNTKAQECGLAWVADSRGLDPDTLNQGPMSRHTMAALKKLGIPFDKHLRFPLVAEEDDFKAAHHVVTVKEAEHRPIIERNFPAWLDRVEFWHVHDLDCCGPEEAFPHLDREVTGLGHRAGEAAGRFPSVDDKPKTP
jgi:protein-tyrosine phosphatase